MLLLHSAGCALLQYGLYEFLCRCAPASTPTGHHCPSALYILRALVRVQAVLFSPPHARRQPAGNRVPPVAARPGPRSQAMILGSRRHRFLRRQRARSRVNDGPDCRELGVCRPASSIIYLELQRRTCAPGTRKRDLRVDPAHTLHAIRAGKSLSFARRPEYGLQPYFRTSNAKLWREIASRGSHARRRFSWILFPSFLPSSLRPSVRIRTVYASQLRASVGRRHPAHWHDSNAMPSRDQHTVTPKYTGLTLQQFILIAWVSDQPLSAVEHQYAGVLTGRYPPGEP